MSAIKWAERENLWITIWVPQNKWRGVIYASKAPTNNSLYQITKVLGSRRPKLKYEYDLMHGFSCNAGSDRV